MAISPCAARASNSEGDDGLRLHEPGTVGYHVSAQSALVRVHRRLVPGTLRLDVRAARLTSRERVRECQRRLRREGESQDGCQQSQLRSD